MAGTKSRSEKNPANLDSKEMVRVAPNMTIRQSEVVGLSRAAEGNVRARKHAVGKVLIRSESKRVDRTKADSLVQVQGARTDSMGAVVENSIRLEGRSQLQAETEGQVDM